MMEGWHNENYLMLFDALEIPRFTESYGLAEFLPDYRLIGLRSWDDFIVADVNGTTFTVPTVPILAKHLEIFSLPDSLTLQPDDRLTGKIKWYIQPVVFGGDPQLDENVTWVPVSKHVEFVKWWNSRYQAISAGNKA